MAEKVINGVFAIALVAMIAINYQGVSQFVTTAGTAYASTIKGLQGR